MTDIPAPDRFTLPGDIPDDPAAPAATPAEDWRARGLAHPAGRGWEPEPEGPPRAAEEPERIGTGDWTVFTPERQSAFLAQLAESGNARLAAKAAGVSPQTAYRTRRKSAALARMWDAAVLAARPVAEDVLADKALNGWEEPVYYRGEVIDRRPRFDARLLLAHLARLDKLAERVAAKYDFDGGEEGALVALDWAIDTLAEGEALPEPEYAPQDPVPGVPSSSAEAPPVPCSECGGWCATPGAALTQADCQWLDHRLTRMNRARPGKSPRPWELAKGDLDTGEIEAVQLQAFELGLDRWWEMTEDSEIDEAIRKLHADAGDGAARAGGAAGESGDGAAAGEGAAPAP